jgi:hypothetical protein
MAEPIFMKLGMYIMAPKPISAAYFINPSHQSVCLYVYPLIVAGQRFGQNITAATNIYIKKNMRLVLRTSWIFSPVLMGLLVLRTSWVFSGIDGIVRQKFIR